MKNASISAATFSANATTYANAGVSLSGSVLSNVANSYIFKLAKHGSYYSIQSASTNAYVGEDSSSYLAGYTSYTSGNCDWTTFCFRFQQFQ